MRALLTTAALLLAACGGGHGSSLPPVAQSHARQPQLNGGGGAQAQPTVYVAGAGAVYAYDVGASGNTPPVGTSAGFYYQAGGPGGVRASIAGIATNAAGDLVVAQNFANPQGDGNSCQLIYIPARSATRAVNATGSPCGNGSGNTTGLAVGVTFTQPFSGCPPSPTGVLFSCKIPFAAGPLGPVFVNDEIDVLMNYQPSGNPDVTACDGSTDPGYEVDRYAPFGAQTYGPVDCVPLGVPPGARAMAIAGSTNGAFFVDVTCSCGSADVARFDSTGTPTNDAAAPGNAGPLAVAANPAANVGYRVMATVAGGITTIYSFKVAPGGSLSFTHALGSFNNPVGALAVDNNGSIYVGVNQPNGATKLKVYGPAKTEATDPDYILNNPVRRPNPAASPAAAITGIAIAQ